MNSLFILLFANKNLFFWILLSLFYWLSFKFWIKKVSYRVVCIKIINFRCFRLFFISKLVFWVAKIQWVVRERYWMSRARFRILMKIDEFFVYFLFEFWLFEEWFRLKIFFRLLFCIITFLDSGDRIFFYGLRVINRKRMNL
jgi:hypothetical protein